MPDVHLTNVAVQKTARDYDPEKVSTCVLSADYSPDACHLGSSGRCEQADLIMPAAMLWTCAAAT